MRTGVGRWLALGLALALMLPAMALAEESLAVVSCAEEHFSTRVDPGCSWEWADGDGLYIYLENEGYMPYILISTDATDTRVTDGETYFTQALYPALRDAYGENGATMMSIHGDFAVAGRDAAAADFQFRLSDGVGAYMLYVVDVRDDCSVYYRVRYTREENRRPLLDALETVVANFRYDPDYYEGTGKGAPGATDTIVSCPQQDFSALCDVDFGTKWEEGSGLYVYTWDYETIPYVLVNVLDGAIPDPAAYIHDVQTPKMQEQYGANPVSYVEYESYDVGGKRLPAAMYNYVSAAGDPITMVQTYDVLEDRTVKYTAKYIYEKDREVTLATLDRLVATLRRGANYYGAGGGSATATRPQTKPDPRTGDLSGYTVTPGQPIVSGLADCEYAEFTARLPAGWEVIRSGLLEDYSFRCYDPKKPERSLFFIGQLGAWLKSEEASAWRRANHTGGFTPLAFMYDNAPVLAEPSLACLIGSMPAMREHLEVYFPQGLSPEILSPQVLPDINQGRVVQSFPGPQLEVLRQTLNRNAVLMSFRDISVERFECVSSRGEACEGMMGGMVLEAYDPNLTFNPSGLDLWFHYGLCLMGFTAPKGEMQELAPVMLQCLNSFRYTDAYLKAAASKGVVMAQTSDLLSSSRSLTDAWEDRETGYDIASQKYSDATLGYDRLYDSQTGEIYRADLDFYDSYDRNREAFANPNLYLIDSGSEDYYLNGVDYYIVK